MFYFTTTRIFIYTTIPPIYQNWFIRFRSR